MTPLEVCQKIRLGLERYRKGAKRKWVVPVSCLRNHVFIRNRKLEQKITFAISWEDILRLDRNQDSCWLLCEDVGISEFLFFVVPHQFGREAVVTNKAWLCKPRKGESVFRPPEQTVSIYHATSELSVSGSKVSIEQFRNRADLFEKLIYPYWNLLDVPDSKDFLTEECPKCKEVQLPNYSTDKHDYQCHNPDCYLLWCGDYWKGTDKTVQRTIRRRKKKSEPYGPGWWELDRVNNVWKPWVGSLLPKADHTPASRTTH